jgi:hypothetical protein
VNHGTQGIAASQVSMGEDGLWHLSRVPVQRVAREGDGERRQFGAAPVSRLRQAARSFLLRGVA